MQGTQYADAYALWTEAADLADHTNTATRDIRDSARDAIGSLIPDCDSFAVADTGSSATLLAFTADCLFTMRRSEREGATGWLRCRRLPFRLVNFVEITREYRTHQNGHRQQLTRWEIYFEGDAPTLVFTTARDANDGAGGLERFARDLATAMGWTIA